MRSLSESAKGSPHLNDTANGAAMKTEKKVLLITGMVFLMIGIAVMISLGSSYTIRQNTYTKSNDADRYQVLIEQDHEIIKLTDKRCENGTLILKIKSVSKGNAYINVFESDESIFLHKVYVHRFGIITMDGYLGNATGAMIIPILVYLYIGLILWSVIVQYRRNMRKSLYQYKNIRDLGWIIFLTLMLVGQITYLFSSDNIADIVNTTLHSASNIALIAFPSAFIVSILVTISNIHLIRKEGRSWRNMLGIILGLLVCFCTVLPPILSELLQRTDIVDVHNERGTALYVEMIVTNTILVAVSYLECILLGTIILSVKAAKKIPAFDKDYILILGCQIKKDGTMTPLLKGRADRALKFALMQKEAAGKDVVFIPSGGKGADEIIPEARAIQSYLVSEGVPDERILVEEGSANTLENFKNSMELIRKESRTAEPKVAFSTTNYHVFRSGVLAEQQGIHAEGIGSKTRPYFWINAFIREFAATLYSEGKKHLKVIALLILAMLAMIYLVYLSNTL